MIFRYPALLTLLLLVPLLVRYHGTRRRTVSALPFSDGHALRRLPGSWMIPVGRWGLPLLYAAGLTLLITALARPQQGVRSARMETEGIDIVLLIDVSTSMRALDFSTPGQQRDRLDAIKKVATDFIGRREHDRIALVAFAGVSYALAPLTHDLPWLQQRVMMLETGMVEDGTAIGTAIISAVNRLRESPATSRIAVLLTDGMNNRGEISPLDAARVAEAMGIRVYTVGASAEAPYAPYPGAGIFGGMGRVAIDIDEPTLIEIARITGGEYFRAADMAGLEKSYTVIDELERTVFEVDQFAHYEERFQAFALWALALLSLERMLSLTRLGRLP
jgi:Ca-activated chloride channel homolog